LLKPPIDVEIMSTVLRNDHLNFRLGRGVKVLSLNLWEAISFTKYYRKNINSPGKVQKYKSSYPVVFTKKFG